MVQEEYKVFTKKSATKKDFKNKVVAYHEETSVQTITK